MILMSKKKHSCICYTKTYKWLKILIWESIFRIKCDEEIFSKICIFYKVFILLHFLISLYGAVKFLQVNFELLLFELLCWNFAYLAKSGDIIFWWPCGSDDDKCRRILTIDIATKVWFEVVDGKNISAPNPAFAEEMENLGNSYNYESQVWSIGLSQRCAV